jgi:hypothetical protein
MDAMGAVTEAVHAISASQVMTLPADEAEAFVIATNQAISALQARQSLAMVVLAERVEDEVARRSAEHPPPPRVPSPDPASLVAAMLAPELHCATRTVHRRLEADWWLTTTDSTFSAHWAGILERPRAEAVVEAARTLPAELHGSFEAMVLETSLDATTGELTLVSERVRGLSRADLARRARTVARQLDPESDERAARLGRAARRVVVTPDSRGPGMARWTALLPSDVSQRVFAAVDGLARQYARSAPGTAIDAHRADALADLVLSRARVATTVELLVPILRTSDRPTVDGAWRVAAPIEDPRHGALLPQALTRLLSDPEVTIRLARLDADGSIVQDPQRYRPSASAVRRVRSRDGGCRFPGCNIPARQSDLDHVIPWPRGRTDPANLICLCRTHHRFKHHGGWAVRLASDGSVTWSAPDGRTWVTQARSHELHEQLGTARLDAQVLHDVALGWQPGLPVGMSLEELVAAEQQLPEDPPESEHTPAPPADWLALDADVAGLVAA